MNLRPLVSIRNVSRSFGVALWGLVFLTVGCSSEIFGGKAGRVGSTVEPREAVDGQGSTDQSGQRSELPAPAAQSGSGTGTGPNTQQTADQEVAEGDSIDDLTYSTGDTSELSSSDEVVVIKADDEDKTLDGVKMDADGAGQLGESSQATESGQSVSIQVNGSGATVCGQPLAFFNERGIQTGGTASLEGSNSLVFNLVSDVNRVNSVRVNVLADCSISVSLMPGMQPNMCYRHNDSTCSVGGFVSGEWRSNCQSPIIWNYRGSSGQIGAKVCDSGNCLIRTQAGTLLWSGNTDIKTCNFTCNDTNVLDVQGRPLVSTSPNRTCTWNGGNVR